MQAVHPAQHRALVGDREVARHLRRRPVAHHRAAARIPDEHPQRELIADLGIALHERRADPRVAEDQ